MKTTHTLVRYDDDENEVTVDVEISYTTYRGWRGSLEEPPEDPSIEIDSVTDAETGDDIELTHLELDECEQAAMDDAYATAFDGPDDFDD